MKIRVIQKVDFLGNVGKEYGLLNMIGAGESLFGTMLKKHFVLKYQKNNLLKKCNTLINIIIIDIRLLRNVTVSCKTGKSKKTQSGRL